MEASRPFQLESTLFLYSLWAGLLLRGNLFSLCRLTCIGRDQPNTWQKEPLEIRVYLMHQVKALEPSMTSWRLVEIGDFERIYQRHHKSFSSLCQGICCSRNRLFSWMEDNLTMAKNNIQIWNMCIWQLRYAIWVSWKGLHQCTKKQRQGPPCRKIPSR